MTKGIIIDNCSDVLIDNNTFENLDIAIEAKGSNNIRLTKNKIRYLDSRIKQLIKEIDNSDLPVSLKRELIKNIFHVVLSGQKRMLDAREKENLLIKIKNVLGKTAWEILKAIISDVIAGKILMRIVNLG